MQRVISQKILGFFLLLGSIVIFEGCRKEPVFNTDPAFRLEFSRDTISFDTVFSTLGSTTLWLQVYNRSNKDVNLQTIELVGGNASPFRMNVSGDTSLLQHNVRLRANDSLFIFVRVTVNLEEKDVYEKIFDYIRFSYNNRSQDVVLEASGQNAIFHLPTGISEIIYNNDTLRVPYSVAIPDTFIGTQKAHIIYGYLLVEPGQTLVLNAGTRLHFAPNSGLIVADGGSLQINGTFENRVIFEGMRMDASYRNITGQWDRIWLMSGSVDNRVNWAIIRNGRTGLIIDNMDLQNYALRIENTIIDNMVNNGIVANNAKIVGTNLQITNCGDRLLTLTGGDYAFEHCTFANYFNLPGAFRSPASVFLERGTQLRVTFTSCIIYGLQQEELEMRLSNSYEVIFLYCNIRTQMNTNNAMFQNCQINVNPYFKNTDRSKGRFDFDIAAPPNNLPLSASGVIGKGRPLPNSLFDLKNRSRSSNPTIGAYEFTNL